MILPRGQIFHSPHTKCAAQISSRPKSSFPFYKKLNPYVSGSSAYTTSLPKEKFVHKFSDYFTWKRLELRYLVFLVLLSHFDYLLAILTNHLPESYWSWGTTTATCRRRSFLWRRISTHFDNSWIRGSWTGCNWIWWTAHWIWWTVHWICSRNDVNFYRSSVGWRYPDLRMSTVYFHSTTSWSWSCNKMWKYVKFVESCGEQSITRFWQWK